MDLSERIIECMYEVTDRLTYHICSRKPNHRRDQHLISSDLSSFLNKNELVLEGRNRLQTVYRHSYVLLFIFILCSNNFFFSFLVTKSFARGVSYGHLR